MDRPQGQAPTAMDSPARRRPDAFAGLYESWYPERNKPEVTFAIVTCAANEVIGEIHDRMPVILDERAAEDWMNPREGDPLLLKRLLVPTPSELLVMLCDLVVLHLLVPTWCQTQPNQADPPALTAAAFIDFSPI
jgi:hypothetical protein